MNKLVGTVLSVSRSDTYTFSKQCVAVISILAGFGVEGDAHAGEKVKHRYLARRNPNAPNRTQVHLLQSELFAELQTGGISLQPGEMGENVTTSGLDLLALPLGTQLHLGESAIVQVTGLRTPCFQMDRFRPGLQKACLGRDAQGKNLRKAGIMGIAITSGIVIPKDQIRVELPAGDWISLGPV